MKATTERSINLSPFLFGDSTTPITIVWLCALTFVGISLLWFWTPHSFGRKKGKLSTHVQSTLPDIQNRQQDTTATDTGNRNHGWGYEDFEGQERHIVRRITNPGLAECNKTYFETGETCTQTPENVINKTRSETGDYTPVPSREINNNFLKQVQAACASNGSEKKEESISWATRWLAYLDNDTDNSNSNTMVRPSDTYTTRIFTRRNIQSSAEAGKKSKIIADVDDVLQIPRFKDYLFDLTTVLPVKISDVKKLGFYIKWSNGHPNFFLREPFDPLHWIYSEPEHLPEDPGNFSLEDNFPDGPNECYNNLNQEIKCMPYEELLKLARSLHLATFATVEVLQHRIRKTYELHINAMETRKTSMNGWVPNYRQYQQMYPIQGKGWFDYVVVVDFECTCEDGSPPDFQNEIIQFPAVLINTKLRVVVDEFNVYVKPTENSKLTAFCTNLTGITQETVNEAPNFPVALQMFSDWLKSHRLGDNDFTIVTDGPTDMGKFLLEQCQLSGIEYPEFARRWINIRKVFSSFYGIRWFNLKIMMNIIGMPFEGCHHNGADDARNIATIFLRLLADGCLAFQNEQIVLDKSLQSSNYHNRSFFLNSVIPFNQYQHNPYSYEDSRYVESQLANEQGGPTYFYLPEIFSNLGNKENAVMRPIPNCDAGNKRERKLFNVVAAKMTSNDTSSSKSKSFSPSASRS